MIAAGSLNKRITLLAPSGAQDASGGASTTLTPVVTTWASIAPMSGTELYRAQQFVAEANIKVVIRYRPGVRANMTVQYPGPDGTRNFQVLLPLNEGEANVELTLLCKEINDQ